MRLGRYSPSFEFPIPTLQRSPAQRGCALGFSNGAAVHQRVYYGRAEHMLESRHSNHLRHLYEGPSGRGQGRHGRKDEKSELEYEDDRGWTESVFGMFEGTGRSDFEIWTDGGQMLHIDVKYYIYSQDMLGALVMYQSYVARTSS